MKKKKMSKLKNKLEKLSSEELIKERSNTVYLIMGCNKKFVRPITNPMSRSQLRRKIAVINTILKQRGKSP